MIRGSCLCGEVRFEISEPSGHLEPRGPFLLCHCNRCRKHTGSAFNAGFRVRGEDFKFVSGKEFISSFAAPILRRPPGYETRFCKQCGSPVPLIEPTKSQDVVIPAGTLDDDPRVKPDQHVFVEPQAPWFEITDDLPQFTEPSFFYSVYVAWDEAGHDATKGYEYFLANYPDSEHVPEARRRLAELKGETQSD